MKNKQKYPKKQVIINRILGYIDMIEEEKTPRKELDTLFILKKIIKD